LPFIRDIPLPDEAGRRKLFELLLKGVKVEEGIDWDVLIKRTEYYTGDDLNNVCRDASMMPLRRTLLNLKESKESRVKMEEMGDMLKDIPISMQDLMEAIDAVKPTNSKEKLDRYKKWMEEFGST
jgi:katanin p60 ATPase-containing subunit A1